VHIREGGKEKERNIELLLFIYTGTAGNQAGHAGLSGISPASELLLAPSIQIAPEWPLEL
jgi:hypothetical protein